MKHRLLIKTFYLFIKICLITQFALCARDLTHKEAIQPVSVVPTITEEPKLGTTVITERPTLPKVRGKSLRTHAQVLIYVEQVAQDILIEELANKGIGNLISINHALSYFKALQKEFLVTLFHDYIKKIKQKALDDMRLYFYLKDTQIKNMVFMMLAPYLKTVSKNIR